MERDDIMMLLGLVLLYERDGTIDDAILRSVAAAIKMPYNDVVTLVLGGRNSL